MGNRVLAVGQTLDRWKKESGVADLDINRHFG